MLTVRPFRNEDPPKLQKLWRTTQCCRDKYPPLPALSLDQLQAQVLGQPMFDRRSIMLALDEEKPVGYIHTTFAPDLDGNSFDYTVGQICFFCVDPTYSDASGAASALLQAGEEYLSGLGARTIFGGSPTPSVPFYTALYSGGETIAILHSDEIVLNAFRDANYNVHQTSTWFHLDLQQYTPVITAESIAFYKTIEIAILEISKGKTWWEGCALANGLWFDAIAVLSQENRRIARLRVRVTVPDQGSILSLYDKTWLASLVEIRVHPDFGDKGIEKFLLGEVIQYLASQNQIVQVEAHAVKNSSLATLLSGQSWLERDHGSIFVKKL